MLSEYIALTLFYTGEGQNAPLVSVFYVLR